MILSHSEFQKKYFLRQSTTIQEKKNPMEMDRNNDNIIYWAEANKLWRNNNLDKDLNYDSLIKFRQFY